MLSHGSSLLRVGASGKPGAVHRAGCGALTATVPNPDSRSGLSPHLQGRAMDEHPTVFGGIDVSKDGLDVHLQPSDGALQIPRDQKGLETLARRLGSLSVALVVLEATGGLEASVAAALAAICLPFCIINPRRIRDFAAAMGRLAKPTRSTPRPSPFLPSASDLRPDRCRVRRNVTSLSS